MTTHSRRTSSPGKAAAYTTAIIDYCESLRTFPHRGTRRDDIHPGLRVTNYRKRTVIAFAVSENTVLVLGIFYGGQDFETILQDDDLE